MTRSPFFAILFCGEADVGMAFDTVSHNVLISYTKNPTVGGVLFGGKKNLLQVWKCDFKLPLGCDHSWFPNRIFDTSEPVKEWDQDSTCQILHPLTKQRYHSR